MAWGLKQADIQSILTLISQQPVCGIIAPTGSGKSTTLIEAIHRTGATVFVVEPRIIAATSLAQRMGKNIGAANVGYAAEGDIQYRNPIIEKFREEKLPPSKTSTSVVYCTSGHMRRVMLAALAYGQKTGMKTANLAFCDVLVIDEAHDQTIDIDAIMAYWKYASDSFATVPRLVLASATLTMSATAFPQAPTYEVKIAGFPVSIEYFGKDFALDAKDLYVSTANAIIEKHTKMPLLPGTASTWLVFCPGVAEVEAVRTALGVVTDPALVTIPAYANMTAEEGKQIFETTPVGQRKIIVATNVAEMAITIDNLSGVFNTMIEKYGETSISGGFRLKTNYIAKSSARQRAGRTGRMVPGFVVNMCTQDFYERLPEQRAPEITRVPIDSLIIEVLERNLLPLVLFKGLLTSKRLQSSITKLVRLGALKKEGANYTATGLGKLAAMLPLSIEGSATIWKWMQAKDPKPLFPVISVICLIDCFGPSYFWYPRKLDAKNAPVGYDYDATIEAHYHKYFERYLPPESPHTGDLEVLINMWLQLLDHFKSLKPRSDQLLAYNQEYSLNNKKIAECLNITRQTFNTMVRLGNDVKLGAFTVEGVLRHLLPILQEVYTETTYRRRGHGNQYEDRKTRQLLRIDTRNPLRLHAPVSREIIALLTIEIQSRTGAAHRFISLSQAPPAVEEAPPPVEEAPPTAEVIPVFRLPTPVSSLPPIFLLPH